MDYNYNFALGSIFFLSLTAAFYLRQRRLRDLSDSLYTLMLCGGLVAVVFDFVSAALEPVAADLPTWLPYSVNILFLLGEQLCLPAFLFYSLASSELYGRLNRWGRLGALLPFFLVVVLLAISPLGEAGIFYLDRQHVYHHGASHWVLYMVTALYTVASCCILGSNYRLLTRGKRGVIALFSLLILVAVVVQARQPQLLLTTFSAGLALTAMYYVLRPPGEQVDPLTGAYCRTMLPLLLCDVREKKRPLTLLLFSVLNYGQLARIHGPQISNGLLTAMSDWLRDRFPTQAVVNMNGAKFVVVMSRTADAEELELLRRQAPNVLRMEGGELPLQLALAVLSPPEQETPENLQASVDFIFRQLAEQNLAGELQADADFAARCYRLSRLETMMEQLLDEAQPQLLLQPVCVTPSDVAAAAADDVTAARPLPAMLDLSLGLLHQELTDVTATELLTAIRQSGQINWYYRQLAQLSGQQARQTPPTLRLCLPLLSAILLQEDAAQWLHQLFSSVGLEPQRLLLRLLEKDISNQLPQVRDNICRLAALGYGFRLDEFAEGYTNVSLLSELPIDTVMIGPSLLRNAAASPRAQALLSCVISILLQTGKQVICAGVDSPQAAQQAQQAAAPLLHGAWCARQYAQQ